MRVWPPGRTNPWVEDDRDPVHRYVELINAGYVSASNSAGAAACPESRVAPRLEADQDTEEEHQPHQPEEWWQERRSRECQEQDADRNEPRHAERGVHALLEEQVPGEVEREPPIQGRGVEEAQRLPVTGMSEHALDADCADDDAGDDREVPVRVGLNRHPDARLALRVAEPVLRGTGDHIEVQPPQAQSRRDAEHGPSEQRRADRLAGGADPDGDDRLADSEDDEQAVALGPVGRAVDAPVALSRGEVDAAPVHDEGAGEEHRLQLPPQEDAGNEQYGPGHKRNPRDRELLAQPGVAARCQRVNAQVNAPHDQVGADQYERPVETPLGVIPGFGNREG